jgi:hypothetical protein
MRLCLRGYCSDKCRRASEEVSECHVAYSGLATGVLSPVQAEILASRSNSLITQGIFRSKAGTNYQSGIKRYASKRRRSRQRRSRHTRSGPTGPGSQVPGSTVPGTPTPCATRSPSLCFPPHTQPSQVQPGPGRQVPGSTVPRPQAPGQTGFPSPGNEATPFPSTGAPSAIGGSAGGRLQPALAAKLRASSP